MRVSATVAVVSLLTIPTVPTPLPYVAMLRAQAGPDVPAALSLINEAQQRYGRLPIGASSVLLYQQYYEHYGFPDPSFIDVCASLVAASLARVTTSQDLRVEFDRSLSYREGLLPVYAGLAQKWGLDGSSTPEAMDDAITDPTERMLFKTSLLADSVATVWSFTLGYQYFKLTAESPPQPNSNTPALTQAQVDKRLRNLAGGGAQ